ncbi:sigma-70 family RNA polymerase sigma factor [Litoribacter ruber]|uniref:Sigma-70 family RNA polymerase sigma factor n=1 Tax=Litoribacter ruber TaxID=702568 RepID=A0AAP2G0M6_9BACT|nr:MULTISPECIES: sigma-70 family RNA polymerase sigma factor [Litoribacter]MBS9523114.1 sigma-70 family RNA polymerase sigma factor [Litoribacter alkaliphilus]MBT0810723.1 sigma-70 family RNA polymerase sigma factor [Litoribacter ruber]
MQEKQIISGLKARNKAAVDYLYEKYSRALFAVVSRIILDRDLAEEVFHDAFVKIVGKIHTYQEDKGSLYTWMANVCRNAAIDKTRSKDFSKTGQTNNIDDHISALEGQSDTSDYVEGIGVRELITELSDDQRFIIDCIYFKGYSHSEIAEEFNIPLGTVKSRVRASFAVLKKKMEKI